MGKKVPFYLKSMDKDDLDLLREYARDLSEKNGVKISPSSLIRLGIKEILKKGGRYKRSDNESK